MSRLALLHLRTSRPQNPDFQRKLDVLNQAIVRVAGELGHDVTLFPSGERPVAETLALVAVSDAVVLMGGEDLLPAHYDGPTDYPGSGEHDPEADAAYFAAIEACLASGTPLLGICRGLQAINVAFGGTLVQHLTVPDRHRTEAGDTFVSHRITVTDPTLAAAVPDPVRCGHHQAVDLVGAHLEVVARAADGTVEALRHTSAPILGVQWHPEHPEVASAQLPALIDLLVKG